MTSAMISKSGRLFSIEREMIALGPGYEPDPRWTYTDKNGHAHQWDTSINPPRVRSIIKVTDPPSYFDDGDGRVDEVGNWHFECLLCTERIVPGTVYIDHQRYVPGLSYYTIDGRTVSKNEFEAEWVREKAASS